MTPDDRQSFGLRGFKIRWNEHTANHGAGNNLASSESVQPDACFAYSWDRSCNSSNVGIGIRSSSFGSNFVSPPAYVRPDDRHTLS